LFQKHAQIPAVHIMSMFNEHISPHTMLMFAVKETNLLLLVIRYQILY